MSFASVRFSQVHALCFHWRERFWGSRYENLAPLDIGSGHTNFIDQKPPRNASKRQNNHITVLKWAKNAIG